MLNKIIPLLVCTLLVCQLSSCARGVVDNRLAMPGVVSLPNRQVVGLDADDIVIIMRRAAFSNEQILEYGTPLRNALAQTGAAKISSGKKTEALFMVVDRFVHISSRKKGSFIYDSEKKVCL